MPPYRQPSMCQDTSGAMGYLGVERPTADEQESKRRLGRFPWLIPGGVVLDEVRAAAGVSGGDLKRVAALLTERAARLKLNGHLLTYSPLSRVLELETLMSAIRGKQSLWVALHTAAPSHPEWSDFDFAALEKRGSEQLDTLGQVHEWAVTEMMDAGT